jgi:hypothetical protein
MKLNEITTVSAEQMGILPAFARAQKLLKLKAIIEAVPFDPDKAESAQREFTSESEDAREGLGEAWDRVVLAIVWGWDIPQDTINALAAKCSENSQKCPKIFEDAENNRTNSAELAS